MRRKPKPAPAPEPHQVYCDRCEHHVDLTPQGDCGECFRQLTIGVLRARFKPSPMGAMITENGGYVE